MTERSVEDIAREIAERIDDLSSYRSLDGKTPRERFVEAIASALRKERERREEVEKALKRINHRASPSPTRTFYEAMEDLEWITAESRRLLSRHKRPEPKND